MICKDCIRFEVVGIKGKDENYNKCALHDIYNLDKVKHCEDYYNVQECKADAERMFGN